MGIKWSFSTHNTVRRCQRQYYFAHLMASHNARDPQRREAYLLKQLQRLETWQGSVVHQAINTFVIPEIRAGRPVNADRVVQQALTLAERQLAFSAARQHRAPGITKSAAGTDFCALYEHDCGLEVPQDRIREAFDVITTCLRNLCQPEGFLAFVSRGYGHKTEMPISFSLNGANVSSFIDLLFHGGQGQRVVVDWKVSRNGGADYERQLLVYAMALLRSPAGADIPPEAIHLFGVNLLMNRIVRYRVTPEKLARTEDFILKSADAIQALTGGGSYGDVDLEDFEYANSEKSCQFCQFLELCRGV